MQRVVVLGTSGSGKTTLARQLAEVLNCPHIELDSLYWHPNWEETPLDEFRKRVRDAVSAECWTLDGNYSKVRDITWARADTVVWLNYSFPLVFWRITKRTFLRVVTRQKLWGTNNRETVRNAFFSKNSMLWWVLKTYRKRRREYPELFKQPRYAHLNVIILHSPREMEWWLSTLSKGKHVTQIFKT